MRLEYMISSTLLIQFGLAGRAEFRPAPYPSKLCENAADFRLGPHDDPLHHRRILRGRGLWPDHRVHAALPAAAWRRAERRPVLGRRDHTFFERRRSAVPAVLGSARRPVRTQAADHPL